MLENCIAIQFLVLQEKAGCREVYYRIVLQEKGCRKVVSQYTLYCDMKARQGRTVLRYIAQPSHDTATEACRRVALGRTRRWGAQARGAGAHRALGRAGRRGAGARRQAGAQGEQAAGARADVQARARGCGQTRGARQGSGRRAGAWQGRAGHGRGARPGVLLANGLCTRCIQARIVGLRLQDMDSMVGTALTIEREIEDARSTRDASVSSKRKDSQSSSSSGKRQKTSTSHEFQDQG